MIDKMYRVIIHSTTYEVDLLNKAFRRYDMPWVTIDFETKWGMKLCRRFEIYQCSECGSYSRVRNVKNAAECSNCGLFFVPAEVMV